MHRKEVDIEHVYSGNDAEIMTLSHLIEKFYVDCVAWFNERAGSLLRLLLSNHFPDGLCSILNRRLRYDQPV